jgi:hypothetical protein
MPEMTSDVGVLAATKAEMCNVSGSMGKSHWYKLSTMLPDPSMDYVQVELWDGAGAFKGGTVHTGTFPVDTTYGSCGVCVRGMGAKGATDQKEYFATGGTVNITAVGGDGAPFAATLSDITFDEIDTSHKMVADGCTASVAAAQISGTVVKLGGTGTGGSGGGGGGGGAGACPTTVGD